MNEVLLDREGSVALITLAAPERRNAFRPDMVRRLLEICDEVDADPEVGAVVIRARASPSAPAPTERSSRRPAATRQRLGAIGTWALPIEPSSGSGSWKPRPLQPFAGMPSAPASI